MAAATEVTVPDIGDFSEVPVIEVLVKPGDKVAVDDPLVTLESDKATMDVPSPAEGVVQEIRVSVGDTVSQGSPILVLEPANGAAPAEAPAAKEEAPKEETAKEDRAAEEPAARDEAEPAVAEEPSAIVHAGPAVRVFAREHGVDLANVEGTGPRGRIRRQDVEAALGSGAAPAPGVGGLNVPPWPEVDFSKFGPTRIEPLSRIKRLSGPNVHRNWVLIPHVTQNDEADITELEAFRKDQAEAAKAQGVRLTMLAFIVKASIAALSEFPHFNSSLDAARENLILKDYYNIGFAADTPQGLVVPVIKNADQKGVLQIARELGDLSGLAREGKLKLTDMQGGTFTISSLGGIGGTSFTPIVNAPEVAILGVSRHATKPVWNGSEFVPRLMLPLSLSYDHRVIDGADGARFTAYLAQLLGDLRRVLL
jgi:pyruvate dehydrogenase E2 component (dihydrolipoamide acetyltransferase)